MSDFSKNLLTWFNHSGRKTLPWQSTLEPYPVWISEIMLQQTQVKTVIPYFEKFMQRFPTLADLAKAPLDEVLTYWAGLGYYARARNLHKMAQILVEKYRGRFPQNLETLQRLPGLGRSTASAILAICFGKPLPILDGNVKRVLTRYCGISGYPGDKKVEAQLWNIAEQLLPKKNIPAYTQAIMDLGAMICTPLKPACLLCPVQKDCVAYRDGKTEALPSPKPKTSYPSKKTFFMILTDGKGVYLEKRPANGIWGGLWSLPEFHHLEDISTWCSLKRMKFHPLKERTHLFTHYRLLYTPVLVEHADTHRPRGDGTSGLSVSFTDLANYALPAPVKRLLNEVRVSVDAHALL